MKRRSLLAGAAVWTAWPAVAMGQAAAPLAGGMSATLTVPPQRGVPSGTFSFEESRGSRLEDWIDPRGAFSLSLTQVVRPEFPGFRMIFVRSRDGRWTSVEFWLGAANTEPHHIPRGYEVAVTGDFNGKGATPNHWWGARWRLSGGRAHGLRAGRNDWPYPLTGYATLLADHLIPQFDPLPSSPSGVGAGPKAAPYTPMGSSSLSTYMPTTGGRGDIGIFNGWDAWYFQTQAPTAPSGLRAQADEALATLMAISEAGASIPWFIYDPAKGCLWERMVNNAGKPTPPLPPSGSSMPLIVTGPPGSNLASSVSDTIRHDNWWVPTDKVIPASGTITVPVNSGGSGSPLPVGSPRPTGGGSPGLTYAWGDPAQFLAAATWAIDSAHQPELGYLSYILFRDPWDLHTIQADALWSATTNPTFWIGQVRQAAWDYAHAIEAWAATPANAPRWIVPKATVAVWVRTIQRYVIDHVIDHQSGGEPNLAKVFHSLAAAHFGTMPDHYSLCDGTINIGGDTLLDVWEESFFSQASALAAILSPGNADALKIAAFSAQGIADRYDDTGWPKTMGVPYRMRWRESSTSHAYASWAEAWKGNAPLLLRRCPPAEMTPPAKPDVTRTNSDYPTGDFAALSLAVQAGVVQLRPQRDWVGAACRAAQSVPYNRAFAQI